MASGQLTITSFADLTDREVDRWLELKARNLHLASPYFHPLYTRALDAVHGNVAVAVWHESDGRPIGIFPFQQYHRLIRPAGWPATDLQAFVTEAGSRFPWQSLLSATGATILALDALLDDGEQRDVPGAVSHLSSFMDITDGWEAYLSRLNASGRRNMSKVGRMFRKTERELGKVRFQIDEPDHVHLDELIALKRANVAARKGVDFFRLSTGRALVHHLLDVRETTFSGLLSSLYVGDEIVARHFGIVSDGVLHWWFPAYDTRFARLGPGWLCLQQLVHHGPEIGLRRIDLGPGNEEYKMRAMTGAETVRSVALSRNSLHRVLHQGRERTLTALRSSERARSAVRFLRRFRQD